MIELTFPVFGDRIPSDHNYALYSALVHRSPDLKDIDWQLRTIAGIPQGEGVIKIGEKSRLKIRCGLEQVHHFLPLTLKLGRWHVELGTPIASEITLSSELHSRIVVIKGSETPESFRRSLLKQLPPGTVATLGDRKKIKIKRFTVIGFEVFAHTESPKTLLEQGLGGKRKMGCGFFEQTIDKIKMEVL